MITVKEKESKGKKLRFSVLMLTAALLIASCGGGGGLTAEQLKELEETKAAALSAEKEVQSQKQEKRSLNQDLAAKRSDLKKLLEEKEVLMEKFRKIQNLNIDDTEADTSKIEESENGGDK